MKRWASLVWVGSMVAVAVVTYAMKSSAGRAADHVMQLRTDIQREKDQMTVLRAEWGVLDQPARLQSLVDRYGSYLDLKPLDVRQLATIDDVPAKPPSLPTAPLDGLRTGSVTPVVKAASSPRPSSPHKKPQPRTPAPSPAPMAAAPAAALKTGELE